jgi:hypothetical protein
MDYVDKILTAEENNNFDKSITNIESLISVL